MHFKVIDLPEHHVKTVEIYFDRGDLFPSISSLNHLVSTHFPEEIKHPGQVYVTWKKNDDTNNFLADLIVKQYQNPVELIMVLIGPPDYIQRK